MVTAIQLARARLALQRKITRNTTPRNPLPQWMPKRPKVPSYVSNQLYGYRGGTASHGSRWTARRGATAVPRKAATRSESSAPFRRSAGLVPRGHEMQDIIAQGVQSSNSGFHQTRGALRKRQAEQALFNASHGNRNVRSKRFKQSP